jgi:rRNA-processing protein FCF1
VALKLYFDHNFHRQIALELRRRKVSVITTTEDATTRLPDADLLDRATELGCVLVTSDVDLLVEAANRQRAGTSFAGVIYCHQRDLDVRSRVEDLELLALAAEPDELANQVIYLPL